MLDRYLEDLRRELEERLPRADVRLRLDEAESHLREGIEGRIECGLIREDAEREAVAAFGTARSVGRATHREDDARSLAVRLRYLAGAYAACAAWYAAFDLRNLLPLSAILLTIIVGCLMGVGVASFRARRPVVFPLLLTGIGASLSFWVLFGFVWLNLWNYGGMGYQSRVRVEESIRRMRADLSSPNHDSPGIEHREDDLRALTKALNDPVGNWTSQFRLAAGLGMSVVGVFTAVDMGFAALGMASCRRRRRPGVA